MPTNTHIKQAPPKNRHKHKVKLARKLRTPQEIRERVSIFGTKAWMMKGSVTKTVRKEIGVRNKRSFWKWLKNLIKKIFRIK